MTNVSTNATTKYWTNLFPINKGYSGNAQYGIALASSIKELVSHRNRRHLRAFVKKKYIQDRLYKFSFLKNKKHFFKGRHRKELILKTSQVGGYTRLNYTILNASRFLNLKSFQKHLFAVKVRKILTYRKKHHQVCTLVSQTNNFLHQIFTKLIWKRK